MAEIVVQNKSDSFQVTVSEGGSETHHHVTLTDALYEQLTNKEISKEACLEAAFRFLLDRESKEMILGRFDVSIISRYFPEFERKFQEYI